MLSTLKPVFVLALLAAGVVADGHSGRHARHHAIAARAPAAEAVAIPVEAAAPVKKRSRKTCRPRSASSSLVASSTAVSSAITSSSVVTTSSEVKTTTSSKATTTSSSDTPPPPPPPPSSTHTTPKHTETPPPPPPPPSPTPTPTPTPTTTKEKPKPTTTSDNNNGGGGGGGGNGFMAGTNSGDGTWYNTGLVACGQTYSDTDYIAAISYKAFQAYPGAGANPNLNPICGKKIRAHYQGKSVEVALVDECMGCQNPASIDFTPAAFKQLADMGAGRIYGVTWEWI